MRNSIFAYVLHLAVIFGNCSGIDALAAVKPQVPAGFEHTLTPDDSPTAVRAAVDRLRKAQLRPACPDDKTQSPRYLGTACATREFNGPAILEQPTLRWWSKPANLWSDNRFVLNDKFLFLLSCPWGGEYSDRGKGLFAFNVQSGKVVWSNKQICEKVPEDSFRRLYILSDGRLLVIANRMAIYVDSGSGKLLSAEAKKTNWTRLEQAKDGIVFNWSNKESGYMIMLDEGLTEPKWKSEFFPAKCPPSTREDVCPNPYVAQYAIGGGQIFVSVPNIASNGLPLRQLHALDQNSGQVIWKHEKQLPLETRWGHPDQKAFAHDGSPMLADGKVIIRLDSEIGFSFRALNPKDGSVIWDTPFLPHESSKRPHIVAGAMLIAMTEIDDHKGREVWAFNLKDGKPAWHRRTAENGGYIAASAGGVIYLMTASEDCNRGLQNGVIVALDSETGTQLWSFTAPLLHETINLGPTANEYDPKGGRYKEPLWSHDWVIGPDGGIYGANSQGPYKIK